jgi:hypothetical protein
MSTCPQDSLGYVLAERAGKWVIKFPGVIAVVEPGSDLIRIVE